ncbi:hypothetical protein QIH23_27200, partial [Klebsiella pneumoniae]|nr:hypothetical protein [Klebsiella pneumoniae]
LPPRLMTAATPFEAEVTATFGRHVRVRDVAGIEHEARPQGRKLVISCGDRVYCTRDTQHEEVRVTEVLPRRTAL